MSLLKPTTKTPFHIDFDWWKKNERDWHVFLRSLLCPEHQEAFAEIEEGEMIDWIDPKTAEVKAVDGIQHILISHCALLPEFSRFAYRNGGGRFPGFPRKRQCPHVRRRAFEKARKTRRYHPADDLRPARVSRIETLSSEYSRSRHRGRGLKFNLL